MMTITAPDPAELTAESRDIVAAASSIVVDSPEADTRAAEFLRSIKTVRTKIKDAFEPATKAAHQAHRSILAVVKDIDAPLAEAESNVKKKVGAFRHAQEQARLAQERRMQEQQRKMEDERRLAEATRLEEEGKAKEAEAVIEAPVEAVPVKIASAVPKTEGVHARVTWKHRVTDVALVPRGFLVVDDKALAALARRSKGEASVSGVEFYADHSVSVSGH